MDAARKRDAKASSHGHGGATTLAGRWFLRDAVRMVHRLLPVTLLVVALAAFGESTGPGAVD